MEKTIEKLFEIEEKARTIIERANDEKQRLHDAFEEDISQMEKAISASTTNKIKEYKEKIEKEVESEKQVLIEKSEHQLKELKEHYQNNHKDIVNQIYSNIITS